MYVKLDKVNPDDGSDFASHIWELMSRFVCYGLYYIIWYGFRCIPCDQHVYFTWTYGLAFSRTTCIKSAADDWAD